MDNEFEKNFINSVENTVNTEGGTTSNGPLVEPSNQPLNNASKADSSKFFKVATVVLAVFVVIESIAIGIMTINHIGSSSDIDSTEESEDESAIEESVVDISKFIYDENNNITAFDFTCTQENGDFVTFSKDNSYYFDVASGDASSGTYSIIRDTIIPLSDSQGNNRVLYFDGFVVADGTTIYDCKINTGTLTEPEPDLDNETNSEEEPES